MRHRTGIALAAARCCCGRVQSDGSASTVRTAPTLTIGLGLASGGVDRRAFDRLVRIILRRSWSNLPGRPPAPCWPRAGPRRRMAWRIPLNLRRATFHDGQPVTAAGPSPTSRDGLPEYHGPGLRRHRRASRRSPTTRLKFGLKRPSPFLLEALEISRFETPAIAAIGTGPYPARSEHDGRSRSRCAPTRLLRRAGPPSSDIVLKPIRRSVRPGPISFASNVDMLYEVGVDALGLARAVDQRQGLHVSAPYAYVGRSQLRNTRARDPTVRRA